MTEPNIVVVYHSGYGHTAKVAHAVAEGAKANILKVDALTDSDWETLDKADAIIFGAPTYMGSLSAQFKTFMDASSKKWFEAKWQDKIAAGFTNSHSYSGDKLMSLQQLMIFSMQHGMIWVGQSEKGPQPKGTNVPAITDINRIGSFSGLMTQSNNESPEITPPQGDLETAKLFGKRVATATRRWLAGKAA
jgi:NAD(P)H dehydrogenase (quinone)